MFVRVLEIEMYHFAASPESCQETYATLASLKTDFLLREFAFFLNITKL